MVPNSHCMRFEQLLHLSQGIITILAQKKQIENFIAPTLNQKTR